VRTGGKHSVSGQTHLQDMYIGLITRNIFTSCRQMAVAKYHD